ncbi:MAG: enoyl-CoA hydratase-related protein [Parvularculaceae bacterium]
MAAASKPRWWRITGVTAPSAKCGLPEVKLGLLPGAGGTQRLPRIVGAERALEMVTSGEHVPARKAYEMGLIDELAEEGALRETAVNFANKVVAEGRKLVKVRDLDDKISQARGKPEIFDTFRKRTHASSAGFWRRNTISGASKRR